MKINYVLNGIVIFLAINLAWIIINDQLNSNLRKQLDDQKLRYEKLLAEKLLLEKKSIRISNKAHIAEIPGHSNAIEINSDGKILQCSQLQLINSSLKKKLFVTEDSIKKISLKYVVLVDSIKVLKRRNCFLETFKNVPEDQTVLNASRNNN